MEHVPGPKDSGGDADLLAVRVLVERRSLRVVLAGELDLGEVATIHREVRRALDTWPGPPVAKLDLSHLRFIDVAGLRALADACRVLQRSARTFDVIGVPRHVRRAVEVTGVEVPGMNVPRSRKRSTVSNKRAMRTRPTPAGRIGVARRFRCGPSGARPSHTADSPSTGLSRSCPRQAVTWSR